MWFQPATQRNIETLRNDGVLFVQPVEGRLACETVGTGKLEDVEIIVKTSLNLLKKTSNQQSAIRNPQLKERFLITSGGTREEIDPVRFISNYSSGKMGFALAEAARDRGAEVTLLVGAASVAPPENVKIIHASSAQAMHDAVLRELPNATVYVSAAAVADYRPKNRADNKIKKKDDALILELEKTPDILAEVSRQRHENLLVIGFAAETTNVLEHARQKLQKKNLDAIVANEVSRQDSGFGSDTNLITILTQNAEKPIEFPLMTKKEAAHKILDEVVKLRENNKLRVKP
jgi:phosphopantothenoylcysteine decarboxylase/phosphopantothenate--cysteine ligase